MVEGSKIFNNLELISFYLFDGYKLTNQFFIKTIQEPSDLRLRRLYNRILIQI